ncbi:MAG: TonB family protein [Reichenbachiella sp.]
MSNHQQHIDLSHGLTPEVMQQYLDGDLSVQDQFHVERYLLDHPFEAEAMQGFEKHPSNLQKDLTQVNHEIDQRTNRDKKVIPIWQQPMRMVAAIALLMLSSLVIYLVLDTASDNDTIVMDQKTIEEEQEEETATKIKQETLVSEATPAEEVKEPLSQVQLSKKSTPIKPKKRASNNQEAIAPIAATKTPEATETIEPLIVEEIQEMDMAFADEELEDYIMEEVEMVPEEDIVINEVSRSSKSMAASSEANVQAASARSSRKKKMEKASDISFEETTITGKVLDESGEGIPGVTVMVINTGYGTITDIDGNYQLQITSPEDEISFSFIGYSSQSVVIDQRDSLTIHLALDMMALEEVVVVGYGTQSDPEPDSYTAPRPTNGFIAYKRYLKDSLQYPVQAKANKVEGKVVLEVTINSYGDPSDIEVLKSLSAECDLEAIRLVKEGPSWQAAKRNNNNVTEKVKVKVKFELE